MCAWLCVRVRKREIEIERERELRARARGSVCVRAGNVYVDEVLQYW